MQCKMCGTEMDRDEQPWTANCGGDCVKCMASAGDTDCQNSMDAARWCEYCRMMAEHDNEAIEAFGSMIPPGIITKEFLDLAMDAWLQQKGAKAKALPNP